jgi:FixJ family two-component response regulator
MAPEPTVFVVDDNPSVREALAELVYAMHLAVECFATAEGFLHAYDVSRPGCLVLDLRMPGMSGIELQERLVADQIAIPVIIVTGHGNFATAVRTMSLGAIACLEKPYAPQQLEQSIQRAIESDAQRRVNQARKCEIEARFAQLTANERLVLDRIIAGTTNKAIANELDISLRTVQFHRAKILKTLNVNSTIALLKLVLPIVEPSQDAT